MKHTITLIPGDGIGPELSAAVVRILERAGLDADWESHLAGALALERTGSTLPEELLDSVKRNKVALKGPVTTPVGGSFASVNVALRKSLDLFANSVPPGPSRRWRRGIRTSIWSSFARTPKTCIRGWSTRSCPGSSRA